MFCAVRIRRFAIDDSGGERDTLGTILLIALIVVPLLMIIFGYSKDIKEYAEKKWALVTAETGTADGSTEGN